MTPTQLVIGGNEVEMKFDFQYALRLLTFRQLHKVLDMDELPRYRKGGSGTRKRRRDDSTEGDGEEDGDGKKDKKEGEEMTDTDSMPTAGTVGTNGEASEFGDKVKAALS